MSALKGNDGATQSAVPWPLTPIPRQNPRLIAQGDVSPKHAEVPEETFDIKPDVSGNNVYDEDTWPELAPVKFEPAVELNPRQALGKATDDDSLEEKFMARIAGVPLASASSSAQSLESGKVPPNNLGLATTLRQCKRPKRSRNWRRDPVVDPEAPLEVLTPRKFAGSHNNLAL